MDANVSARGYTNVLLVLNMKRFIQEEDQARFENIRGTEEFAKALRDIWPQRITTQEKFITIQDDKRRRERPEDMTTEDVGFATGVFRSLMLERYTFPAYSLDKDQVEFNQDLMTNFQFSNLFWRAWKKWSIYVRVTNNGFFVIRLTRRHFDHPRSFLKLANDVLQLQESLDVQSALNWLKETRSTYSNNPKILAEKEKSIRTFLSWLGVDETNSGNLLYYPIQWRLAMEVCGLFVDAVGLEIPMGEDVEPIHLQKPVPSINLPLHDSYVVHHFTEVFANLSILKELKSNIVYEDSLVSVDMNDVKNSIYIRQALSNLIEGSVLKPILRDTSLVKVPIPETGVFPDHHWSVVDDILKDNESSWNDELCILKSKTAIIMPAVKWKDFELSVSSVPGATLRVKYLRYWGAIERMIEFIVEIRVLSQLIESESYRLLGQIAQTVHETRSQLFSGDIKMDKRLPNLVTRAAYLRHLAALCRSLSHPQLWSRAEYAIHKANHFLDQLGVPTILEHVERNINSINSVVDHVDELYLADLSETNNDTSSVLSLVLAAASFTLTLLVLPSFWTDIWGIIPHQAEPATWQWALGWVGTFFGLVLIIFAVYLIIPAWRQRKKIVAMLQRLYTSSTQQ